MASPPADLQVTVPCPFYFIHSAFKLFFLKIFSDWLQSVLVFRSPCEILPCASCSLFWISFNFSYYRLPLNRALPVSFFTQLNSTCDSCTLRCPNGIRFTACFSLHPTNHHSSLEHAIYGTSCLLHAFLHPTTCHLSNLRSVNLVWSPSPLSHSLFPSSIVGALCRPPCPFPTWFTKKGSWPW